MKAKKTLRSKLVNIRVSPEEFAQLDKVRKANKGLSIAKIFRESIPFICEYYGTTIQKDLPGTAPGVDPSQN